MKRRRIDFDRKSVVVLIIVAAAAVALIAMTVSSQVARGQSWIPALVLPLATGAVAGGITIAVRRSRDPATARTGVGRWAIGLMVAGLVLMATSVLIIAFA